jgi:tRNA guanosine-2'-O-methyltransferase
MSGTRFNVKNDLQNLSANEIREEYKENASNVAVACINLSGDMNVGMIVRTASIFGVGCCIIMGRRAYDKRPTVGSHSHIPVDRVFTMTGTDSKFLDLDKTRDAIIKLQDKYTVVFVEQTPTSIKLQELKSVKFEKPPMFIFGNESMGVDSGLLKLDNTICVEIEQRGVGRSLNVSTACGIVLYEWFR